MKKCSVKYCRNKVKGGKCNSCASRQKRARNPLRYAYDVLKMNAKRREKPFTITFDYFKKFAIETDYIAGKGRTKKSYSVDRIRNDLGYVPGNLRVLTCSDNARKATRKTILSYDWETKFAAVYMTPVTYKKVSNG